MSVATIFKHYKTKLNPKYAEVDAILESIRLCNVQSQVDLVRAEQDEKRKKYLKGQLPNICFSGKFSERKDNSIISHSGFAILDIDHIGTIEQVEAEKEKLKSVEYIYSCFVSPSGDGLKILVRIPAVIEDHRAHYEALMQIYPQLDTTSQNESRICYASADANIYINKNAVEFTDKIIKEKPKPIPFVAATQTDYFRINVAAKMVRDAGSGEKLKQLLKAATLLGGYIATGNVEESEAIRVLESEIQKKDIDDFDVAQKAIKDGIEYGKTNPIFEKEFKQYAPPKRTEFNQETPSQDAIENDNFDFVADEEDVNSYITQIRDGSFKMGQSTGHPTLDKHWVFKDATLVIINGHDNVGKSVLLWYLATLSAVKYGWKWIIYSNENKPGGVKKKIIEFKECKTIKNFTEEELMDAYIWFDEHFTIIKNTELYTYSDMIKMGTALCEKKAYNGFLIDPYNGLWRTTTDTHEYDYKAMTEFRQFISKTKCSIYVNCHAITEALRRKYAKGHPLEGYPMPPEKADTEGGGKFSNKADDFLTIHRLLSHPTEWVWTDIHVKKIKEMETGGKHTRMDEPVRLRMSDSVGFEDINGFNPLYKNHSLGTQASFYNPTITTPNYNADQYHEPNKKEFIPPPF